MGGGRLSFVWCTMEQFGFHNFGKMLILIGAIVVIIGLIMTFWDKIPFLGKLPGDFSFKGKGYAVYIPLATGLIISLLLTLILNIFFRK